MISLRPGKKKKPFSSLSGAAFLSALSISDSVAASAGSARFQSGQGIVEDIEEGNGGADGGLQGHGLARKNIIIICFPALVIIVFPGIALEA
jgi:hypothetical protein